MEPLFFHIGIIIIAAAVAGFLARLSHQPLIPAYILAGFLLGPVLGLIQNTEMIATLSELGIVFLLFLVGLEIDISKLKPVMNVAVFGGLAQLFFTGVLGYLIAGMMGFNQIESSYLGLVFAMSSTMIVVKLLSDRREIDTVHGRVVLGILILQDLVAIAALFFLQKTGFSSQSVINVLAILGIIFLLVRFFMPYFLSRAAHVPELLLFVSLSVCFFLALLFQWMGFSVSIGAFIAGLILANQPYHIEMTSKVRALRDFFATLFFVSLGFQLPLQATTGIIYPLLIFVGVTLLIKPIIILGICSAFGYAKRPAFLSSISLAQVSEFSLIIAAQGYSLGHINSLFFSFVVLLTIVTISLTSYVVKFEATIYHVFLPLLCLLEKCHLTKPPFMLLPKKQTWDIVLCGFHRIGQNIYRSMKKKTILVIDYDPDVLLRAAAEKIPFIYGDASDPDVLAHAKMKHARVLVSTIPDLQVNVSLLALAKKANKNLPIIVTAHDEYAVEKLYAAGASHVIYPHELGGKAVAKLLRQKHL